MTLLEQIAKSFEANENNLQNLYEEVSSLRKENADLRNLLNEGEKIRGQYVICCVLHVPPEVMMKYIK